MPDIEAVGDAATGGMLAVAVEPRHGGGGEGHTHERACLNCSTDLTGEYCHACGQRAHVHRTIGAFWHDLLHGVLHFEGKIWRTLPLLAWHPGVLTRRYIEGKRASYVSPIALFLFSVFLMFAVVNVMGGPFQINGSDEPEAQAALDEALGEARIDAAAEIGELQKQREQIARQGASTARVDAAIAEVRRDLSAQETLLTGLGANASSAAASAAPPAQSPAGDRSIADVQIPKDDAPFALGWLDEAYSKAKENPKLLLYKVQTNAYKFSWALIPISVPFLWLMFLHRSRYRRRFGAYDHVVFVTYSLAFMTLGFVLITLIWPVGLGNLSSMIMLLVPPVHMYRQLRGAYELSRGSALWRTVVLLLSAQVAAAIFLALLLMLGVLG